MVVVCDTSSHLGLVSIRRRSQAQRETFFISLFSFVHDPALRTKLNRETENFSRHSCNICLMETGLYR